VDLIPTVPSGTLLAPLPGRMAERQGPDETQVRGADLDGDGRVEVVITTGSAYRNERAAAAVALRLSPEGDALVGDADATARLADQRSLTGLLDLDGDGALDAVGAQPWPGVTFSVLDRGAREVWPFDASAEQGHASFEGTLALVDLGGDGALDLLWPEPTCLDGLRPLLRTGARAWSPADDRMPALDPPIQLDGALVMDGHVVGIGMNCQGVTDVSRWALGEALTAADLPVVRAAPGMGALSRQMIVAAAAIPTADGASELVVASEHEVRVLREQGGAWVDLLPPGAMPAPDARGPCAAYLSGLALVDLDADGVLDVVAVTGDDATSGCGERGAPLHHRAWRRAPGGGVEDWTAQVGLEGPGNHGTVLTTDLEGDGDADLLLSGMGVLPAVLRNDLPGSHLSLTLRAAGPRGPWPAVGAQVIAEVAGLPVQRRWVGAETAKNATIDPWVFVSAGAGGRVDRLTVRWPSGQEEVWEGVAGGQHLTLRQGASKP
jgi:hypothetical protein